MDTTMPRSTATTNGDQPHRTVLVLVLGTVGTWSTGICPHRTMLVLGLVPWAPWAPSRYLYTSKGSPPFGSFEVRLVYILDLYVPSIHCHDYSPTSPDITNLLHKLFTIVHHCCHAMAPNFQPLPNPGWPESVPWAPRDPGFVQRLQQAFQQDPQGWATYLVQAVDSCATVRGQAQEAREAFAQEEARTQEAHEAFAQEEARKTELARQLETLSQQMEVANLRHQLELARTMRTNDSDQPKATIKIADPDRFDGAKSQLRAFKSAIENKVMGNAHLFPSDKSEIAYIVGLLKGRAQNQVEARRRPDGDLPFHMRHDLFRVLDQAFGDPDEKGTAQRRLMDLRQAHRPFSDFFAEFQRHAPLSRFGDEALKSHLERGLAFELSSQLNTISHETMSLEEFATLCQQVDSRTRRNAATRATPRGYTAAAAAGSTTTVAQSPAPAPAPPGDPMDLSAASTRRGPVTDNERARRRAENLCYYCGGSGHTSRYCPNRSQRLGAASTVAPGDSVSEIETKNA